MLLKAYTNNTELNPVEIGHTLSVRNSDATEYLGRAAQLK